MCAFVELHTNPIYRLWGVATWLAQGLGVGIDADSAIGDGNFNRILPLPDVESGSHVLHGSVVSPNQERAGCTFVPDLDLRFSSQEPYQPSGSRTAHENVGVCIQRNQRSVRQSGVEAFANVRGIASYRIATHRSFGICCTAQ